MNSNKVETEKNQPLASVCNEINQIAAVMKIIGESQDP
jgi:hypothetical protein